MPLLARPLRPIAAVGLAMVAGCGGEVSVPEDQRVARQGAELFLERCSGCHSLEAANSYGSKPEDELVGGERTNGPNFNIRKVDREDVLYAIRNGGFSGAIMPANIVTGQEAGAVAEFLSRYSGRKASGQTDVASPGQQE